MKQSLRTVPNLLEVVQSKGAGGLISRTDLTGQLLSFLRSNYPQCQVFFGEGCVSVDLDKKSFTTSTGRVVEYNLLIAADGVNSSIRKQLVSKKCLKEQHFMNPLRWKALRIPPQTFIEPLSFQPLLHPDLQAGRVLARYPEGHISLLFWNGGENPGKVTNANELKHMLQEAVQGVKARPSRLASLLPKEQRLTIQPTDKSTPRITFEDDAVDEFITSRSGRSQIVKVDRFHDDSVALCGDAAHGMYNLLGQGASCGMRSAQILTDCLLEEGRSWEDDWFQSLNKALANYTERALPGAHAVTHMNLIGDLLRTKNLFLRLVSLPVLKFQQWRKKAIFQSIRDPSLSYEEIAESNRMIIWLSKLAWRGTRIEVGTS